MDREILLSQYTDLLSVGVYVRRGWEGTQEQALAKAKTLREPLQNELTTGTMGPSPTGDAIRRPWWDNLFHTGHTWRESRC